MADSFDDTEEYSASTSSKTLPLEPTTAAWRLLPLALTPVLAVFTAGARPAWALALMALLMGLSLLLLPPRSRLAIGIWLFPSLALVLSLSFALPVGHLPEWRTTLMEDYQINSGGLRSPQPWIALERWLLIAMIVMWLWCLIVRCFTDAERRLVLRTLTIGLSAIIAAALWIKWKGITPFSFWARDDLSPFEYGPFPNRNHFAGLCAITGILSFVCSYDSFRRRSWASLLFSLCLVICFAAMMLNTSRFGVVMFFLGCGIWMLTATLRGQSARKMAVFSSLFLFGTTFLLIYGQRILQRFSTEGNVLTSLATEGRFSLYRRVLSLLPEAPWAGWGLGSFDQVFALLDPQADSIYRASHPENDLLWFAFESGIPAALCFIVASVVLIAQFGPWRPKNEKGFRRDRRLRNASAIAALMILAQGLVDVPLHMIGMALVGATLAALGYNNNLQFAEKLASDKSSPRLPPLLKWLHVPAALFCLVLAFTWWQVHRGLPVFPTDTHARNLLKEAQLLASLERQADSLTLVEKAIKIRPLHWEGYFRRATLKLALGQTPQQALADFARARGLEKNAIGLVEAEARIWADYHPAFAIAAYAELMRREPSKAQHSFGSVMGLAHSHPHLRPLARAMAGSNPKLHLTYTLQSSGDEFRTELELLLRQQPDLAVYNKAERLELFRAWYAKGDAGKLIQVLKAQPAWLADGWSVLAGDLAAKGDFKSACETAFEHAPTPLTTAPPSSVDIDQLTRLFLLSPTDIARGLQLYELLKIHNRTDEALKILDELSQLPSIPNKVIYERALMLSRKKEYAKSWETLQFYLATTNVAA